MVKISTKVTYIEKLALDSVAFKLKSLPLVILYNIFIVIFAIVLINIKSYTMAIVTAVVFVVFNAVIFGFRFKTRYNYKFMNQINRDNPTINYEFDEDKILIAFSSISEVDKFVLNYGDISRIVEDKEYIYMFINANNAFILKKINGTEEEITFIIYNCHISSCNLWL